MAAPKTIIVDTRETKPLPAIRHVSYADPYGRLVTSLIRWEKKALVTADYTVPSRVAGVERKGTPRELWGCLFGKRQKGFLDQMDRMANEFKKPYLFTEFDPFRLSPTLEYPEPIKMGCVMLRLCQERGIAWLHYPGYASRSRESGTELVCRALLQASEV